MTSSIVLAIRRDLLGPGAGSFQLVKPKQSDRLAVVRLDGSHAGIPVEAQVLGVGDDHPRRRCLQVRNGLHHAWREHPIAIIGNDQRVCLSEQGNQTGDQRLFGLFVERAGAALVIAHQHVPGRDHAALGQGAAEGMCQQMIGRQRTLLQGAPQQCGVGIAANHRQEGGLGAQRLHVDGGVGRTTRGQLLLGDGHDRHRRLAAQAVGRPFQVHVEHSVTDNDNTHTGECTNYVN